MIIEIREPLYETKDGLVVGIYDKKVNDAIRLREFLRIKCKGHSAIYMPKWIRKNCKTIKKVFLRPKDPMRLYKVFIPKKRDKVEEERKLAQLGVFG